MNPYKITHSSLVFHLAYAIIQYPLHTICNPRENKVAKTATKVTAVTIAQVWGIVSYWGVSHIL